MSPVLMSHSGALQIAAAIRKTGPGLIRVGVQSGSLYVEHKPHGGEWADVLRLEPPRLPDDPGPLEEQAT